MRTIPLTHSLLTFLDHVEYSEAGLAADEETSELAKPFAKALEDWDSTFKEERQSRREVVRAEAVVAVRNSQLDALTTRFGASLIAEAGGLRTAKLVQRFFPIASSTLIRWPLRKQCEHTLGVMVAELGKVDKKSPLQVFAGPLETMAKGAVKALDARTKAKGARAIKANDVDEYKEGINAMRLSTYAELLKVAAEKGYPRTWADAFFRSESASAPDASPDEPAAPGEGGATPPASP